MAPAATVSTSPFIVTLPPNCVVLSAATVNVSSKVTACFTFSVPFTVVITPDLLIASAPFCSPFIVLRDISFNAKFAYS